MKTYSALLLFLLLISFVSCCKQQDDNKDLDTGIILHEDFRDCAEPYCGGWFISIHTDTFRFIEIPDQTDVNFLQPLDLPMVVELAWERYDSSHAWFVAEDLIKVTEMWKE